MTDTVEEVAFRYAVDAVNDDPGLLPDTRLTAQIERIPPHDSFYASKQGNAWPFDVKSFKCFSMRKVKHVDAHRLMSGGGKNQINL